MELHRVPKKVSHQTFGNNFLKSQPIFKILSLLNRGWISPTKLRNIFHHTLSMYLHYLGKVNSSNLNCKSIQQWKNFENRLRFEKVIAKSLMASFFWDTVFLHCIIVNNCALYLSLAYCLLIVTSYLHIAGMVRSRLECLQFVYFLWFRIP